uniref:Uncharacterized protein n=1 Tax=Anguilla anguilla TaxID=7936 RepID=A0A0E9RCG8_ANGAN
MLERYIIMEPESYAPFVNVGGGMNKGTQSKSELISAGRNNRAVFNQHFDV